MAVGDYYARGRTLLTERPLVLGLVVALVILFLDAVRQLVTGGLPLAGVATFLWEGIILGLSIGLAGIGLSMTYSILGFANFSHGDLMTSGAFVGWATTFLIAGVGKLPLGQLLLVGGAGGINVTTLGLSATAKPLAVLVGLVVAAAVTALLAVAVDRVVYRPMREESGISLLIASVGVALVLRYLLVFVFQANNRGVTTGSLIRNVQIPIGAGSINADVHELTLLVVALALLLGVHFLLQRTKLGKAMRAMADNDDLARITGIRTERVVTATWVLGGALTGAAGFLIALERGTLNTDLGWLLLLLIFAAVILGGIGSVYGAIFGGLIIGIASRLSLIWLPSSFLRAAAFIVMVLVLLVRPSGLFKGVTTA
jgi:branched-chain amino acid transport system permease protein